MRRGLFALLVAGLLASACGNNQLGLSVPACPVDPESLNTITGAIILQMQAVDTAEFVPCLNQLDPGWSYEDLMPERGQSRFWLNSDRVGSRFLEVTLNPTCEVGAAPAVGTARNGSVTEYRQVDLIGATATVVIVPVTGREIAYAQTIESELEARPINERTIFVVTDDGDEPLADKVSAAAAQGRPIIVVDEQDVLARTATLQMPTESQSVRGLEFNDLFDRLDRLLPKPKFTGMWFRVFDGGCITYEFDAKGAGVDRLAEEVEDAVGLFPARELRQILRGQGVLG